MKNMPETASLGHMLRPVKSFDESARGPKSEKGLRNLPDEVGPTKNGDNSPISGQSSCEIDQKQDDFNAVLSRKIEGQNEQTLDKDPQECTTSLETAELNTAQSTDCSDLGYAANPVENMGEKSVPEPVSAGLGSPFENPENTQSAENAGIVSETMNSVHQTDGQPFGQIRATTVQPEVPGEKPVPETITAAVELPVDNKQVPVQKEVMAEGAAVTRDNDTESKHLQTPMATEAAREQHSSASDPEIRPVPADQDKSVHPDFQSVLRGARQEHQREFQSQSGDSGAAGQFQDETQEIKDPQGVPLEAETFIGEQDGISKGFEVRNVESMLHSAEPAQNASPSALEAPARTGIHTNIPQMETVKPVDQILQHLSSISVSGPQQQIKLTLTPEHLGTVRITFNQTDDEVVGLLEVQKNQTRRQVEQAIPQLISAMQSSGVQVRRIEVVQWDTTQDGADEGGAKESNYSAADQFHHESSSNSSESQMLDNVRFAEQGQKPSKLSEISEREGPLYGADVTENGLNMFV
jgi:flagellar hook-length control protein FliK